MNDETIETEVPPHDSIRDTSEHSDPEVEVVSGDLLQQTVNGLQQAVIGPDTDPDGWKLTFSEREFRHNIYTCVLVRGVNPAGNPCYAYFGIFYESLPELRRIALSGRPFNPRDVRAIVLARALGDPTPEIEDYMRMKFSFASDRIILECSGK